MYDLRRDRDSDTEASIRAAVVATVFIIGIVALLVHAGSGDGGESSTAMAKVDAQAATTAPRSSVERTGEPH